MLLYCPNVLLAKHRGASEIEYTNCTLMITGAEAAMILIGSP
jgi:hypothetical protein